MSNERPTPMTDAKRNEIGKSGVDWHHSATLMTDHARQLERDLDDAREKLAIEELRLVECNHRHEVDRRYVEDKLVASEAARVKAEAACAEMRDAIHAEPLPQMDISDYLQIQFPSSIGNVQLSQWIHRLFSSAGNSAGTAYVPRSMVDEKEQELVKSILVNQSLCNQQLELQRQLDDLRTKYAGQKSIAIKAMANELTLGRKLDAANEMLVVYADYSDKDGWCPICHTNRMHPHEPNCKSEAHRARIAGQKDMKG